MEATTPNIVQVYLIKKDGTYQKIGKIIQSKTPGNKFRFNVSNMKNSKNSPEPVINFHRNILDYIKKDIIHPPATNLENFQTFNVFFIDDIIGIVFKKIQIRKGNIYFVFQKSKIGTSFLCYIVPYENHSSNAFGISFSYNIQDAKREIIGVLPVFIYKLSEIASIHNFFKNGSAKFNVNSVNRNFGI